MSAATQLTQVLRFESFELDLRSGELRKRGVKLRLQGLPLQLLAVLVERAGQLVTREELRNRLWPADTFVDFDHSLHNAVGRVREVLGDSAEKPRYIETLPRRGYRFIASVEEIGAATPELVQKRPETLAVDTPPSEKSSLSRRTLFAAVMVLVCVGSAIWLLSGLSRSGDKPLPIHSIAVLPLDNLSGDPSQDYFVDGMTDELTTDLAKVTSLRVISRTSTKRYKGTSKTLPEIARELNVDAIVEGSVVRAGQRLRITAQLLHAPTDQHLWAETYDRDLGDSLKLQGEVAHAIAQQVRAQLTPQQQAQLQSAPAVNPEAYDDYLRGRYYITSAFSTVSNLNTAKSYFEASIHKDPSFALAYVGVAESYMTLAFFRHLTPEEAYRPAKAAISKALELDPNLGQAHTMLALLSWRYERDWTNAEREFSQALALAPSYDCGHAYHSNYMSFTGHRNEALEEVTRGRELNPGSSFASTESAAYFLLRDYEGLVTASSKGIASDPAEWLEHFYLGVGYEGSGKAAAAIPEYQRAIEMSGGDQDATAALAHAYAAVGKRNDAQRILRQLEQKAKSSYVSPYMLATIYAGLGDKDKAFALLEKAYQERSLDLSWSLKADLRLDNLRSDPRFQVLSKRVGLPV